MANSYMYPYNNIPIVPPVSPYGYISANLPGSTTSIIPRPSAPPLQTYSNYNNNSMHADPPNTGNNYINNGHQVVLSQVNLQICKINNNRGSFNTFIPVPAGRYPTLQALQTKIDSVATEASGIVDYDLYYRYGQKGTKYQLKNDDHFMQINWQDERLTFNIVEKIVNVGQKRKNDSQDDSKAKKSKKFDKINEERKISEQQLDASLPEELKNTMTRADMVQAAYLHATNPELWTLEKIEEHYRGKISKKKALGNNTQLITKSNDNDHINETLVSLQSVIIKLQDRVSALELEVQLVKDIQ